MTWLSILPHLGGTFLNAPSHLAPCIDFPETKSDTSAKICPLTNTSFLSVKGKDACTFLQGQLTCDMREVTERRSFLTGHCNPKGRLHAIFQVFEIAPAHFGLIIPTVQKAHLLASLKKYGQFSKIEIQEFPLYGFGLVGRMDSFEKIDSRLCTLPIHEVLLLEGERYIRLPCHDAELFRYMVIVEDPLPTWQKLQTSGFHPMGTLAWHSFTLLALIPNIYPKTTELHLPHYLSLPALGAVSFQKGCYTGQEIVARMEYLGNVKKGLQLRSWKADIMPEVGETLIDYVPVSANTYLGLYLEETNE